MPLLSFELQPTARSATPISFEADKPQKHWTAYIPLCCAVILLLSPHPSLLLLLIAHHLLALGSPLLFLTHLTVTYTLTFLAFTSLLICCVRDPGAVSPEGPKRETTAGRSRDGDEISLTDALLSKANDGEEEDEDDDFNSERRWCKICWGPKPERTHHCSTCGRCVLKMDHHCPWMAGKCLGHNTYPSFVHFLTCVTLLAAYLLFISSRVVHWYLFDPTAISLDDSTPYHAVFLVIMGFVFTFTIGSFLIYHLYLISTGQTTIEHLSPYLLLRYLPPMVPSVDQTAEGSPSETSTFGSSIDSRLSGETTSRRDNFAPPYSFPPPPSARRYEEHELSYAQRRKVRSAHGRIRMYDLGWQRNFAQIFGKGKYGWLGIIGWGGKPKGDGYTFPKNPRSNALLAKLAKELRALDENRAN